MLVGGAAHELNNIFSQTLLLAEVLSSADLDDELRGMLASLQLRVQHGIGVVNRMFEQSHTAGERLRFDARHLVASVHRRSDDVVGSGVRISHRYPEKLAEIHTSPQRLLDTLLMVCRQTASELSRQASPTTVVEVIADAASPDRPASGVWVGATAPPSLRDRGLIDDSNLLAERGQSEFLDHFFDAVEALGAQPSVRPAGAGPALGMVFPVAAG